MVSHPEFMVQLLSNQLSLYLTIKTGTVWAQHCTIQYAWRISRRTSLRGHFQNGEHAPGSEVGCKSRRLSLLLSCDFDVVLHNDLFFFGSDDPMVCSISNPDFVIYSSVVSFYLPFIVTLLVYIRIYVFLRMRRKRITFGQASGKVQPGSTPPSVVRIFSLSLFPSIPFCLSMFSLWLNYF